MSYQITRLDSFQIVARLSFTLKRSNTFYTRTITNSFAFQTRSTSGDHRVHFMSATAAGHNHLDSPRLQNIISAFPNSAP